MTAMLRHARLCPQPVPGDSSNRKIGGPGLLEYTSWRISRVWREQPNIFTLRSADQAPVPECE